LDVPKEVEERITKLSQELAQIENRRKEIRDELKRYSEKYRVTIKIRWRERFSLSEYIKALKT